MGAIGSRYLLYTCTCIYIHTYIDEFRGGLCCFVLCLSVSTSNYGHRDARFSS